MQEPTSVGSVYMFWAVRGGGEGRGGGGEGRVMDERQADGWEGNVWGGGERRDEGERREVKGQEETWGGRGAETWY